MFLIFEGFRIVDLRYYRVGWSREFFVVIVCLSVRGLFYGRRDEG